MTRLNKSPSWNMSDLEEAMKDLDRDKSRDALGQAKGSHPKKNLLLFVFFQFRLDPPHPRCFLESFEELFSKPDFIRTKVPLSVWTLVIPPNFT